MMLHRMRAIATMAAFLALGACASWGPMFPPDGGPVMPPDFDRSDCCNPNL